MYKITHNLIATVIFLISPVYILLAKGSSIYINSPVFIALTLICFLNLLLANVDYEDKPVSQKVIAWLVIVASVLAIVSVFVSVKMIFTSVICLLLIAMILHIVTLIVDNINLTDDNEISTSSAEREQGTVKWFNTGKGFGFIIRASGEEIFVHFRAIRGRGRRILREGQKVEFSVAGHNKGLQAQEVIVVSR